MAEQTIRAFRRHEQGTLKTLYRHWQESKDGMSSAAYQAGFLATVQEASTIMDADRDDSHATYARAWTPPPKGYVDDLKSDKSIRKS